MKFIAIILISAMVVTLVSFLLRQSLSLEESVERPPAQVQKANTLSSGYGRYLLPYRHLILVKSQIAGKTREDMLEQTL